MFPNPKMDDRSRAFQGVAERGRQRHQQAAGRAQASATQAARSLQQAHKAVDRADRAMRAVEGEEGDRAIEVEHEATATRRAHYRCEGEAKQAGAAARKGDARRAERAASEAAGAAREAGVHATAASKAAR